MTTNIADATKNAMLDSMLITTISLHSDDPGVTGTNEISSANYSRQSGTFTAAESGSRQLVSDAVFNLVAEDNVRWVCYWNDATFLLAQSVNTASFSDAGNYTLLANSTVISL